MSYNELAQLTDVARLRVGLNALHEPLDWLHGQVRVLLTICPNERELHSENIRK